MRALSLIVQYSTVPRVHLKVPLFLVAYGLLLAILYFTFVFLQSLFTLIYRTGYVFQCWYLQQACLTYLLHIIFVFQRFF